MIFVGIVAIKHRFSNPKPDFINALISKIVKTSFYLVLSLYHVARC